MQPSFAAWHEAAPRLQLRLRAGELVGPCPACGGTDRFHVRPGLQGRALVGCRGCIDGRPTAGRQYGEVLRAAFGHAGPRPPAPAASPPPAPAATGEIAAKLWQWARLPHDSPAQVYLAERRVWPPAGVGPSLPASVRWLERLPARLSAPAGHGAVVFAWHDPQERLAAVSLEAIDAAGRRPSPRWRRTYGTRRGARFRAAAGKRAVVITEGEVTALAAVWRHDGAEVLAAGGTAGLRAWRPDPGEQRPVIIEADGDAAGDAAARAARDAAGGASVNFRAAGDLADELADDIDERLAALAQDGAPASLAAAWQALAGTMGMGRRRVALTQSAAGAAGGPGRGLPAAHAACG